MANLHDVITSRTRPQCAAEDYTVAWLCALPESEQAAAMLCLDEQHKPPVLKVDDENTYRFGSIEASNGESHNVIVACLPPEMASKVSAAIMVAPLSRSFPNLKIHLFVGIAGGVPRRQLDDGTFVEPDEDIHLGDVVVGWPKNQLHPPVVQYDNGRQEEDEFEIISQLQRPDRRLVSALGGLLMEYRIGTLRFEEHVVNIGKKSSAFRRPSGETDQLYMPDYRHENKDRDCSLCDKSQLVPRPARKDNKFIFHRGTIASGDTVMKKAKVRDAISKKCFDALCFEKEAAGIADQTRCLVIRGIADYADSHKNSQWHDYAAAKAAAFAKEFLYHCAPAVVKDMPFAPIDDIDIDAKHAASLQSLSFPEMTNRRNKNKDDNAIAGTCGWVRYETSYSKWLTGHPGLLWIVGKPGAGKSTLIQFILDSPDNSQVQGRLITASFFVHGRGGPGQKAPLSLFRSLLHQILLQIPTARNRFSPEFHRRLFTQGEYEKKWTWQLRELQKFFRDYILEAAESQIVRIFVDALNECGSQDTKDLVDYFQGLITYRGSGASLSVCLSCRHYPDLSSDIGLSINVDDNNRGDIETYLVEKLKSKLFADDEIKNIRQEILKRSQGIFQWVILVTRLAIESKEERGETMPMILNRLGKLPEELEGLYRELLQGFKNKTDLQQSQRLLRWICFAFEPLSIAEIRFAMIINKDNPYHSLSECQELDEYQRTDEGMATRIKYLSKGLAEIKDYRYGTTRTETKQVVQFIHQSVNDYLLQGGLELQNRSKSISELAHFDISRSCIRYLSMQEIEIWSSEEALGHEFSSSAQDRSLDNASNQLNDAVQYRSDYQHEAKRPRLQSHRPRPKDEYPLWQYATKWWPSHVQKLEAEKMPQGDLLQVFRSHLYRVFHTWRRLCSRLSDARELTLCGTLLHVTAWYGLPGLMLTMLEDTAIDVEAKNESHQTALHLAALRGHTAVAQLLLQKRANPNSQDESGRVALHGAAQNGCDAVVHLLLENGANVNAKDRKEQTPLQLASQRGQMVSAQLLLGKLAKVNIQDSAGLTALHLTAKHGHEAVARSLLEHEANVNMKGAQGETALNFAASYRFAAIVRLLLASGASQERGPGDVTALRAAVLCEHEEIATMLLKKGVKKPFWEEALRMAKTDAMKHLLLRYQPSTEKVELQS